MRGKLALVLVLLAGALAAYLCWRIAGAEGADQFLRAVATPQGARDVLSTDIASQLGTVVGQMRADDLVSIDRGKVDDKREELRRRLLDEPGPDGTSLSQK